MLPKQTEIQFYKADALVHTLIVKWRANMTHLLVTISDAADQLLAVLVEDTCLKSPVKLLGASIYKIRAYGLRYEYALREQTSKASLYSVEALQSTTIIPSQLEASQTRHELDMTAGPAPIQMSGLSCRNKFEAEVSENASMEYRLSADLPEKTTTVICTVYNERRKKEYILISNTVFIPLPAICLSRTEFKVQAVALNGGDMKDTHSVFYQPLGTSTLLNVKTYMNKDDLQMLQKKAEVYCQEHVTCPANYAVKKLYRNKPKEYFDKIMADGGLMPKYDKDNNGDPHSSINHRVQGLFFSASLNKKRRPPYFSFFGNKRLFLPVDALIDDSVNMYFADFYCNNEHSKVHYITVVITKNLSKEDIYCKQRLLKLQRENSFFTVMKSDGQSILMLPSVDKFHVEFLYTEDIDIVALKEKYGSDKVTMKFTKTRGRGRSKADGIPKVRHCPVCNLSDTASSHLVQGHLVGC